MLPYATPTPPPAPATPSSWPPPAPASINSTISSIVAAPSKASSRNWSRKANGTEIENRLGPVLHHRNNGLLRRRDALQRIVGDGATQVRIVVAFLLPAARLDGGGDRHHDAAQAHTLPYAAESHRGVRGHGRSADPAVDRLLCRWRPPSLAAHRPPWRAAF